MDSCENCGEGAPVQCVKCTSLDCQRIAELERERDELLAVIAGVKLSPVGLQLVAITEGFRKELRAARDAGE